MDVNCLYSVRNLLAYLQFQFLFRCQRATSALRRKRNSLVCFFFGAHTNICWHILQNLLGQSIRLKLHGMTSSTMSIQRKLILVYISDVSTHVHNYNPLSITLKFTACTYFDGIRWKLRRMEMGKMYHMHSGSQITKGLTDWHVSLII